MQYKECDSCGAMFKKRSMISTKRRCDECDPSRKNKHRQQQVRDENMTKDTLDRLKTVEKKLNELELLFDIQEGEINTVVRDIEAAAIRLMKEAVEVEVDRIFDEKIELVDSMYEKFHKSLAMVNTRVEEGFKELHARPPLVGDMPEKESPEPPKPSLSDLQMTRLERVVKYLKRHKTADKRELQETVWHDLSDNVTTRLLKIGVDYGYFIIDRRTLDKTMKKYRLPDDSTRQRERREFTVHPEYDDMKADKEYKRSELPNSVRMNLDAYLTTIRDGEKLPLLYVRRRLGDSYASSSNERLYVKPSPVEDTGYVDEDEYYGDVVGDY